MSGEMISMVKEHGAMPPLPRVEVSKDITPASAVGLGGSAVTGMLYTAPTAEGLPSMNLNSIHGAEEMIAAQKRARFLAQIGPKIAGSHPGRHY